MAEDERGGGGGGGNKKGGREGERARKGKKNTSASRSGNCGEAIPYFVLSEKDMARLKSSKEQSQASRACSASRVPRQAPTSSNSFS